MNDSEPRDYAGKFTKHYAKKHIWKHGRNIKGSMDGIYKEAWKGYERKHGRNMQGSMYGNILLCSFSPFDVKNGVKGV